MRKTILFVAMTLFLVTLGGSVFAQAYGSGLNSGQTQLSSSLVGSTYHWILSNVSDQSFPTWDVLIWSLKPFNLPAPVSTTAPPGWSWSGTQFDFPSPLKYFTPPAIPPGGSGLFSYEVGGGPNINVDPDAPVPGFLAHVGAVDPNSGTPDGSVPWQPTEADFGAGGMSTWHDIPSDAVIPEWPSISLAAMAAVGLIRRKRMQAAA